MQWNPVGQNFKEQWKALANRKDEDHPETLKITKALPVMKWTESFQDFLSCIVGIRTIPLTYVIRTNVDVAPVAAPPIAAGHPHAEEFESLEDELVARASHNHAAYRKDNSQVYYLIEEATRTTSYAASIKPFQRCKNGHFAWFAIVLQYAGKDKWHAKWKKQDKLLHTTKWRGQSNYLLERFIGLHQNAYVSMLQCIKHVQYQLPLKMTRVIYLLNSIECDYAPLQAAMAFARCNETMKNSFEATASPLMQHCPVAKKRNDSASRRSTANVSEATATDSTLRSGIGKTGVELRFHKMAEYKKLSKEQQDELRERNEQKIKTMVAQAVTDHLEKRAKKDHPNEMSGNDAKKAMGMIASLMRLSKTRLKERKLQFLPPKQQRKSRTRGP